MAVQKIKATSNTVSKNELATHFLQNPAVELRAIKARTLVLFGLSVDQAER